VRSLAIATGGTSVELRSAGADVVFDTLTDTRSVVAAIGTLIAEVSARVAEAPGSRTQPSRRSAGSDRF
jgi:hypothetical protein